MMHFIHNTLKLITSKSVLQIQLNKHIHIQMRSMVSRKNQHRQTILGRKIWLATEGVLLSGQ